MINLIISGQPPAIVPSSNIPDKISPFSVQPARKPLSDESRSDDQGAGRNDTASPYNPSSQGIRPSADSAIFPIFRLLCTIFLEALIPEAINLDQTSVKRSQGKRGGGSLPPWRLPRPAE